MIHSCLLSGMTPRPVQVEVELTRGLPRTQLLGLAGPAVREAADRAHVALAASGFLLNATGFDVALGGQQSVDTIFWMRVFDVAIPVLTSGIAIWAIATYPITEEKAHEVRVALEARRGSV